MSEVLQREARAEALGLEREKEAKEKRRRRKEREERCQRKARKGEKHPTEKRIHAPKRNHELTKSELASRKKEVVTKAAKQRDENAHKRRVA